MLLKTTLTVIVMDFQLFYFLGSYKMDILLLCILVSFPELTGSFLIILFFNSFNLLDHTQSCSKC